MDSQLPPSNQAQFPAWAAENDIGADVPKEQTGEKRKRGFRVSNEDKSRRKAKMKQEELAAAGKHVEPHPRFGYLISGYPVVDAAGTADFAAAPEPESVTNVNDDEPLPPVQDTEVAEEDIPEANVEDVVPAEATVEKEMEVEQDRTTPLKKSCDGKHDQVRRHAVTVMSILTTIHGRRSKPLRSCKTTTVCHGRGFMSTSRSKKQVLRI